MPHGCEKPRAISCLECGQAFTHVKKLSTHTRHFHGLTSKQYTIKHFHEGVEPRCPVCGVAPRFVSLGIYKTHCKEHAKEAMSIAGKTGGKIKKQWNKGQTKETDERVAALALKQTGEGNHFFGKKHTSETIEHLRRKQTLSQEEVLRRIALRSDEFEFISDVTQYESRQDYFVFRCKLCNLECEKTLVSFERGSLCPECFPRSKSIAELEIFSFVKNIYPDALSGDRKVLKPKELDIWVPNKNVAIEYNGLYWHSDGAVDKNMSEDYHLKKLDLATKKVIRLVQFFSDEWRNRREACQNVIRCCLVYPPSHDDPMIINDYLQRSVEREFFEKFHVNGFSSSSRAFGLKSEGKLIAVLSVKNKGAGVYEIVRFVALAGHDIEKSRELLCDRVDTWCRSRGGRRLVVVVAPRLETEHQWTERGFSLVERRPPKTWFTDNVQRFKMKRGRDLARVFDCGSLTMKRDL